MLKVGIILAGVALFSMGCSIGTKYKLVSPVVKIEAKQQKEIPKKAETKQEKKTPKKVEAKNLWNSSKIMLAY